MQTALLTIVSRAVLYFLTAEFLGKSGRVFVGFEPCKATALVLQCARFNGSQEAAF